MLAVRSYSRRENICAQLDRCDQIKREQNPTSVIVSILSSTTFSIPFQALVKLIDVDFSMSYRVHCEKKVNS